MDIAGVVSEDNNPIERLLKRAWLVAAAFFVGRCSVFGINPFMPGFLIATCSLGEKGLACGISMLLGALTFMPQAEVSRYMITVILVYLVMNIKKEIKYRQQDYVLVFFASVAVLAVNIVWSMIFENSITVIEAFAEAALAFSAAVIYSYAIKIIINDYVKIAIENQAALSAVVLVGTVLAGMPLTVADTIVVAESFALFSILYAMYRFGFGIGISWTTIAGVIMSLKTGEEFYLTNWLVVAIVSFAMLCVLKGGRIAYGITFAAVYYAVGFGFYENLLTEDGNKALLTALFIFLLFPAGWVAALDERVKNGELDGTSPEWAMLVIKRVKSLAKAFKRIDYVMANDETEGVRFLDVGEIIDDFTNQLSNPVPIRKTIEAKIIEDLNKMEIAVRNLVLTKNRNGIYEVYITLKCNRGRLIVSDNVRKVVEEHTGLKLSINEDSRAIVGRNYDILCLEQRPEFKCETSVRTLSRYANQVSGDNFYVGTLRDGRMLFMIADGMGNGEKASYDSSNLLDALEELLMAGFDREMSLKVVNSYLSRRNKGESFATLDMFILDLHTGYGNLYKQGAAATYIKRDDKIEIVKSTSLPVGIVEGVQWENCEKKLYADDTVIMISDGVLESIVFENKEEYLRDLIMNCDEMASDEMAEKIIDEIKAVSGNRLRDDATIIIGKLVNMP